MRLSNIAFIIEYTTKAYVELGIEKNNSKIEKLSDLINKAMTSDKRIFHNPHHIWNLLQEAKGIEILGVLFHDIIYQQIDDSFSDVFDPLYKYVSHKDGMLTLSTKKLNNTENLNLVKDLFGVKSDEDFLKFNGQNEFLSALLAVEVLRGDLTLPQLSQVVTLIEATIPFRALNADGNTCYDALYERYIKANEKYSLELTEEDISEHILRCQKISYMDLASFYKFPLKEFISDAWKLIPESSASLLNQNTCTTKKIRHSMYGMYKFYSFIDPHLIFQQFQENPAGKEYNLIISKTKKTLDYSIRYLRVRLIEMGLLEILADLSGGEFAHSLFVGDVPYDARRKVKRIEMYITELKKRETDDVILKLLVDGLSLNSKFEYKRSLLGAHVYQSIGEENIQVLFEIFTNYFDEKISGKTLLENISQKLVKSFIRAMSEMAPIRAERLQELI